MSIRVEIEETARAMKGLILSGGKGTRLRPLTLTQAKQLLPVANKPVLFYAMESLIEAGIREIGIVVGDASKEIQAQVGEGERWHSDVHITYVYQQEPLGLAHAVKLARPFLGRDRFLVFLGDNILTDTLAPMISPSALSECTCRVLLSEVADPCQFGIAEVEPDSTQRRSRVGDMVDLRVRRLVEKPLHPFSNLALVGVYLFDHRIFTAIDAIRPSARGELEITDAIQWLIDRGEHVCAQRVRGRWFDTGRVEDILEANAYMLQLLAPAIHPEAVISADSHLLGPVRVEAGARIEGSVICGPAIVGENCRVRNACIGPYTSVSHHAVIDTSDIEYSIALAHSCILGVPGRIKESLIGRHAQVRASWLTSPGHKLMISDYSCVELISWAAEPHRWQESENV